MKSVMFVWPVPARLSMGSATIYSLIAWSPALIKPGELLLMVSLKLLPEY